MRYLRTVAPAAVDRTRVHLLTIAPDASIRTYAITTTALAKQSLAEEMRGMSIGVVPNAEASGENTTVGIALTRAGRLAITS